MGLEQGEVEYRVDTQIGGQRQLGCSLAYKSKHRERSSPSSSQLPGACHIWQVVSLKPHQVVGLQVKGPPVLVLLSFHSLLVSSKMTLHLQLHLTTSRNKLIHAYNLIILQLR